MADNERNDPGAPPTSHGMTTPPAGNPVAPPPALPGEPGPPPAMRPPTEVTPDQVRQFQEFQRFQELMREQAERGFPPGNPPPGLLQPWGPPPPKPNPLKRLLKRTVGKLLTALVVVLLLLLAGYIALDYFSDNTAKGGCPAKECGGKKAETNLIFSTTPKEAVQKIYDDIAQGDAESACGRFEPQARAQFTKNMSEYGRTCEDIVTNIHNDVVADRMKNEYANPWIPASAIAPNTDPVSVSSCALEVTGGPRLGLLTLRTIPNSVEQNGKRQWIVSAHAPEPADCGGLSTTTSTAPSN